MKKITQIIFLFFAVTSIKAQKDTISIKRFFMMPEFGISISSMPESSSFYYKEEFVSFPIGTNFCYLPFEKRNIYFKTGINSIKRGGYHYFIGYENYRIITNYIDIPLNVGFFSNKKNQLLGGFMEFGIVYNLPNSHTVETPSNLTFPVGLVLEAKSSNYNISLNGRIGILIQDKKYKFLISYSNYKNIKRNYYEFYNRTIMFSLMIPIF